MLFTKAFGKISKRRVVTAISGTTHGPPGQFGNMLFLAVTYASSLSDIVERSARKYLFHRTIRFLLCAQNILPAHRADATILAAI
ncbi:C6 finger domain protein [Penicillium sp. IBT 18751x]|nr:C6 finger domain protein [Penicillium sp. IBT 18751x]